MTIQSEVQGSRWWRKYRFQVYLVSLFFALPALINFTIFRYYPIAWAFRTSFWDYSLLGGFQEMVGFDNYLRALTRDRVFIGSLNTTMIFALVYVPIQLMLSLGLAVFTNQRRPGVGALRAIVFIPVITSFVVVSIVWGMILNQDVGLLNSVLQSLGLPRFSFLNNKQLALPTIIAISIWKNVGYSVIVLVAGLKSIPDMYYEAAIVDGANAWQRFWNITLPMIRRQIMFVTVWATLGAFQVFIPVYSLTRGGPARATNVVVYEIYRRGFIFNEMGYASALSIILLLLLLVVSVVQMRLLRSE